MVLVGHLLQVNYGYQTLKFDTIIISLILFVFVSSTKIIYLLRLVQEIESYVHINSGEKTLLSAQQISSCAKNGYFETWGGCNGSWPEFGFSYAQLFGVVG